MPGRETRGFGGSGVSSQVGLIVIALVVGLVLPVGVVAFMAARDPEPRSCQTGVATSTHFEGAVAWSTPGELWFADGNLSRGRAVVNYAPVRQPLASPSPGASAAPTVSPVAVPAPASAGPTPSPSATAPPLPGPEFEAAAVSADRHVVAFLVSNPPDSPGNILLRAISPLDPPGTAPLLVGRWPWVANSDVKSQLAILPDGHILVTIAHKWDPPESDPALVAVGDVGPTGPKTVESDPQHTFLQADFNSWPELKGYKLPSDQPRLQSRVISTGGRAAGLVVHIVSSPLVSRTLDQIVDGRAGSSDTTVVCAGGDPLETVAFAPDGHTLAVATMGNTELLDLDGSHALTPLLHGRLLAWRQ